MGVIRKTKLRLLGLCPKCNEEDSIFVVGEEEREVKCRSCNETWRHWDHFHLKNLVPVQVEQALKWVVISYPESKAPFAPVLEQLLLAAISIKFDLCPSSSKLKGVKGTIAIRRKRKKSNMAVEFDPSDVAWVGLFALRRFRRKSLVSEAHKLVFDWVYDLLKILCEDELVIDGKNYGRGAIIKLDQESSDAADQAYKIFKHTLIKHEGNKEFAEQVFGLCAKKTQNPFKDFDSRKITGI